MAKERINKLPTKIKILAIASIILLTGLYGATGFLGGIVGYFCGKYNYRRAKEYKKEGTVGFLLGQWFTIFGILLYEVYVSLYTKPKPKAKGKWQKKYVAKYGEARGDETAMDNIINIFKKREK